MKEFVALCILMGAGTLTFAIKMPSAGSALGDFIRVGILQVAAYIAVSSVFLERSNPFGSRYGNNRELAKLLVIQPILFVVVLQHTFPGANDWVYAFGMFVGTHFVFLDNFTLLQSFGCKVVQPTRWNSMTFEESCVGAGIIAALIALIVLHVQYFTSSPAQTLISIGAVYLVALVSLTLGHLYFSKTHSFHSHHYFNFMMILPLTRFPFTGAIIAQSFVLGSIVEGIACWGMDPLFHDPLSKGTCFATQFWTSLIPCLSPDRKRWLVILDDLDFLFSVSLNRIVETFQVDQHDVFLRNIRERITRDQALLQNASTPPTLQRSRKVIEYARRLEQGEYLPLLAFFEVVVFGLSTGSDDLRRMAPSLLGLDEELSTKLRLFAFENVGTTSRKYNIQRKHQIKELLLSLDSDQEQELHQLKCELIMHVFQEQ